MESQHCGRRDIHPVHVHRARPRQVVVPCVCGPMVPCICPERQDQHPQPRQEFRCSGVVRVEGAPAHMPVAVAI